MKRRILRIAAYSTATLLSMALILGMAFYVRLANGPVSLNFLTGTIQERINSNLGGLKVSISGVVIERAAATGIPQFRLKDIELRDAEGHVFARAPRAAIGIEEGALFTASIVPRTLELIGPRISVKRTLEGKVELGFETEAAAPDEAVIFDDASPESVTNAQPGTEQPSAAETVSGQALLQAMSGSGDGSSIGGMETIRVTDAIFNVYDEANDSFWMVPDADLAFRRMPYGFAIVANSEIANGKEKGTWHADIVANYRAKARNFAITVRFSDLVPANVSQEIYALAQLARVKVPLSGHGEVEVTDEGVVTKASAEFLASAGEVGFPDYLAQPIIVDEGSLHADYDPVTGGVIITESTILVGGSQAELKGKIVPLRADDGRLSSIKISLEARNVAIDTQGTVTSPVAVDRIDFLGNALIDEAKLEIEDLVVMSGDTGVRVRGSISGGGESAGLLMSGRVRDLSAKLLKRLWPPIMAPKTRKWVNENIKDGRIVDGEFQVNLPVDALARAQRDKRLPDNAIDLRFSVAGVTTSYFRDLPLLRNAAGNAKLRGNDFVIELSRATVDMPSGVTLKLEQGSMFAKDIVALETLATYKFTASGPAQGIIEYMDLPALNFVKSSGIDSSRLAGDAAVNVAIEMPMIKNVPKGRIKLEASAKVTGASLKGALPKIDVTEGDVDLSIAGNVLTAAGTAKFNGIPARLKWNRTLGQGGLQSAELQATLDGEERKKLGVDLGSYLSGSMSVKAKIADLGDPDGRIDVEADLGKTAMKVAALNWTRPPTDGTTAAFTYWGKSDKGRRVEDLVIKGPGISIKGDVGLGSGGGFKSLKLSSVRISDENIFSVSVVPEDGGYAVDIKGDSFDARPFIKSMFSAKKVVGSGEDSGKAPISITANLDRIYAFRGEIISGVSGTIRSRGSRISSADISGTFLSGQPIVVRVTPSENSRELRINGRDGGAALRAANLYSKVAGGQIEFYALMANDANSSVRQGQLVIRNFEVRNEAALAELDRRGKPKKSGPRQGGITFTKLTLPYTTDARFIRIGDSLLKGPELGATAEGLIRKSDGAIDITGTIIPAYGLNSAIGEIPLLGDILAGGKGQGVFGLTYAFVGTIDKPVYQINPVSAVAPGILRRFFEFGAAGSSPQKIPKNPDKIN